MSTGRGMRALLLLNAFGCLAAAAVLIALPSAIPATSGISIAPAQYMISRLLGAAELAIATACFGAAFRPSPGSVALVVAVLIVFHAGSVVAGAAELTDRFDVIVVINMAVRSAIVAALLWLAAKPSRE